MSIDDHSGSKYVRCIYDCLEAGSAWVDIYAVLKAFGVTCPARQHAIKKLLAAGIRNKGSETQDLEEARDAVLRAIEMSREGDQGQ